ncbi:MAG: hypothetical protein LBE13_14685 [Bacteroidales bacterium]|jgi:hypothetical protein|nr:hypothetical protein [Bacteroidales bacterium]
MHINVGSPYNCAKIALRYALGSIERPVLKSTSNDFLVFHNSNEEVLFNFPELNYSYINKLPVENINSFGQEEYGKFFYEYGRVLFANLIVAITHLDWYAAIEKSNKEEFKFVSEYYHEIVSLNNKVNMVLDAFCDTIKLERKHPVFDFIRSSLEIMNAKEQNSLSSDALDIKNTKIMVFIYTALWFSITGYLLLFCERADIDGVSRFLASQASKAEANTLLRSIADSQEDDEKKINICSLLFIYFHINRYYLISSGLTIQDPLLDIVAKISYSLINLIKDEEDFIIIDNDLISGVSGLGPSIASFSERYDLLDDIVPFQEQAILKNDIANIWAFGKEYAYMYESLSTSDPDFTPLENYIEPCITKYIKKNSNIASYLHSDNINIEKAFLYITNIIIGVESDKAGVICPGTILQLTLIASTFRLIEKSSGFSTMTNERRILVEAGIDIIDMLIIVLYKLWFLSNKYFIQPKRPKYTKGSIGETLEELREEVLLILEEYFEFVHYRDKADNPKYGVIKYKRLIKMDKLTTGDIVNDFFNMANKDAYITESIKHGIYTIAYSALCNGINDEYTIEGLAEMASTTELEKDIINKFSKYSSEVVRQYTKIPLIDAMMSCYYTIKQHTYDEPNNIVIAIYALLYDSIEKQLEKNSTGNYFEFSQADNLTKSYRLESIIHEYIKKPSLINI